MLLTGTKLPESNKEPEKNSKHREEKSFKGPFNQLTAELIYCNFHPTAELIFAKKKFFRNSISESNKHCKASSKIL